jgi:hypothetical protein
MCLQWCHVTQKIINNDYPCVHCEPEVRFGKAREDCATCCHVRGKMCALTSMPIPRERTCCHHNADLTPAGRLELGIDHVAAHVLRAHRARDLVDLFWLVESAPEPNVIRQGVIEVDMAELAVPFIYGIPSTDWDGLLE